MEKYLYLDREGFFLLRKSENKPEEYGCYHCDKKFPVVVGRNKNLCVTIYYDEYLKRKIAVLCNECEKKVKNDQC